MNTASAAGVAVAAPPDLPASPSPVVTGYVEAATPEGILGWAWIQAQPEERLTIELLLDGRVIATAVADSLRDDLAHNGIGDGRHAFLLRLPENARARAAEARVIARAGNGPGVPLGQVPPPEGVGERLDRLQRGLDMVITSQRVLHRTLQASLMEQAQARQAAGADDGTDEAAGKDSFAEQLRTLGIFMMRLDERLAILAPIPPATGTDTGGRDLTAASMAAPAFPGSGPKRPGTLRIVIATALVGILCLGVAGVAVSLGL